MRTLATTIAVAACLLGRAAIAQEEGATTSSAAVERVKAILGQSEAPAEPAPAEAPAAEPAPPPPAPPASPAPASVEPGSVPAGAVAPAAPQGNAPAQDEVEEAPASQLVGTAAGNVPATSRDYYVRGRMQARAQAVVDEDPANNRYILYSVEGGYKVIPSGAAFLRLGLRQNFVAEEGESGLLFRDMVLGFKYTHTQSLEALGLDDRSVTLTHVVQGYLPTSRASANQDLFFAPELFTRAIHTIHGGLSAVLDFNFQYRFHEFAERAGPGGGLNTQLLFGSALTLDYVVLEMEEVGVVDVGAAVYWTWYKSYPSAETFEAPQSDQTFWTQDYGWELYASWAPNEWLGASLSLEQNAPVLRDGLVNTSLFNRDELELVLTLTAQY